jgi:hypothetical protein
MAALAGPDVIDAFAISGDLGWDGTIEVLVHLPEGEEPSISDEPWAAEDFITYEVRWDCPGPGRTGAALPQRGVRGLARTGETVDSRGHARTGRGGRRRDRRRGRLPDRPLRPLSRTAAAFVGADSVPRHRWMT